MLRLPQGSKRKADFAKQTGQQPRDTSDEVVYQSIGSSGSTSKRMKIARPEPPNIVLQETPPPVKPATFFPIPERELVLILVQNAKIIADFEGCRNDLGKLMLSHEADARMGTPCHCESGALREAMCHDCIQYPASCRACFVRDHRYNPFHWVELWDSELGFYRRHDMSMIGPALQIGHNGEQCGALADDAVPRAFTITHTNGVHRTLVHFCAHTKEDTVDRLMHARLFPATFDTPLTGYTFQCMKEFQLHNLESKQSAYDYCGSLMRLMDNVFAAESASEIFENFIRSAHLWSVLTTEKRGGQLHNVDVVIPHRREGTPVVLCPACPEASFNMDKNMPQDIPTNLRHLRQARLTIDGNFHCNKNKKTSKNSDPTDTSLYTGKAHFPEQTTQKEYLANAPKSQEKSTCNYLKAINNQDKKKFKNREVTGIVNVQCSHVFVQSSVDLEFGERFVNVDAALAHALRQTMAGGVKGKFSLELQLETGTVDRVVSYDIACQYHVKVVERFRLSFPDLVPLVEKMRWAVPAVHVQGHQDGCIYEYSTAYMIATGHFHGETAEQYWPELNQIGPKVWQMNYGHRQDTIINHHNDWNHKKMAKIVVALVDELNDSKAKFAGFEAHFLGLCENLVLRIESEGWWKMARETQRITSKVVKSVYMYDSNMKVLTQLAIYTQMLSDEAAVGAGCTSKVSEAALVLKEGIAIQQTQITIRNLVDAYKTQPLAQTEKDISKRRIKARDRIAAWRLAQMRLMPAITPRLVDRAACDVEDEVLFLPSDFTAWERREMGLGNLELQEGKLREAIAFEGLKGVQVVVPALVTLRDHKQKQFSGQVNSTASLSQIVDCERRRDKHIRTYMGPRKVLLALGICTGAADDFPALTVPDTFMKSRRQSRKHGASRMRDGWETAGIKAGGKVRARVAEASSAGQSSNAKARVGGTVMGPRRVGVKQQKMTNEPAPARSTTGKKGNKDGWLWTFGKMGKMTAEEMKVWSAEGDRVQWFRAEADMQRWEENVEQKLAELRTTTRSFVAWKDAWTQMASMQEEEDASMIGAIAYAKQKAHMFHSREQQARNALLSYPEYACLEPDDADLLAFVTAARSVRAATLQTVLSAAKVAKAAEAAEELAGAGDSSESGSGSDSD
ncbi:hypothetical protein DFH09DRAFT_1093763 [Mycena vulgaris]|nr:hypothetical protein DFH09DRAFT_1093763 [Mycena vulgaris]